MITEYEPNIELDTIIDSLVKKLGGTLCGATKTEYIVKDVEKDELEKNDFEFIGYDASNTRPMYRWYNIECFFDNGLLHIYELSF